MSPLFTDPGARGSGAGGAVLNAVVAASTGPLRLDVPDDAVGTIVFYERPGRRQLERRTATWLIAGGAGLLGRECGAPVSTGAPGSAPP